MSIDRAQLINLCIAAVTTSGETARVATAMLEILRGPPEVTPIDTFLGCTDLNGVPVIGAYQMFQKHDKASQLTFEEFVDELTSRGATIEPGSASVGCLDVFNMPAPLHKHVCVDPLDAEGN